MGIDLGSALQRSRQALLNDALPLFSSKTRVTGYHPQYLLTPLAIHTLHIGPHSFPDTTLYLVEWDPNATPSPSPSPPPAPRSRSFLDAIVPRLNQRADNDEELGKLIRLAGSKNASREQLVRVAQVIEEIKAELDQEAREKTTDEAEPTKGLQFASTSHAPPGRTNQFEGSTPVKTSRRMPAFPVILLEFAERKGERYALPSHYKLTATPATPDALEQVRLDCIVFPGQRPLSILDEQQLSAKGKGRELPGQPVPLSIIVEEPVERAQEALWKASRSSRPIEQAVEAWWKQMLLAVTPQSIIEQPTVRTPSPTPEPEEEPVMWRLSSFAKIDWVYDDELLEEGAKKKSKSKPKKTQASVALSRQGSKGVSTPASSSGLAATPEPAAPSSARGSSIAPASEPDPSKPAPRKRRR